MPALRALHLRRFSAATAELAGLREDVGFSERVLHALVTLIPVDRASYNEVDRASGRVLFAHSLSEPSAPALVASLNAHIHQHPVFAHPLQGRAWPPPMKISDFLTQREFRGLGLWQEHFRLYGIYDQLGTNFAVGPTRKLSFGLNRRGRNFTEEERLLLDLVRPHVARARARVRAEKSLKDALAVRDSALASVESLVAVTSAQGDVLFATPALRGLLGEPPCLPVAVRTWLAKGSSAPCDLRLEDWDGRAWKVGLVPGTTQAVGSLPQRVLRFQPQSSPGDIPQLASALGLGRREAEVLHWVAQGKRNAEIAIIAGMREATVAAHLRRLLDHLGVETRTAAAAMAWEKLGVR